MSIKRLAIAGLLILALLAPGASASLAQPAALQAAPAPQVAPGSMLFVENAGQWPDAARLQVWGSPLGAGTTWLADDAIWLVVGERGSEVRGQRTEVRGQKSASALRADLRPLGTTLEGLTSGLTSVRISFPGSNPEARIEAFEPLTTTVSYFLGSDPAQWRPAVPVWGAVRYVDLYPGVDLALGGPGGNWRLEARAGAAVEQVRVQVEGASVMALDGAALRLEADGEPLTLTLPAANFTYQVAGRARQGEQVTLAASPNTGGRVAPRAVPRAQPADDPGDLFYGTFLGGSASDYGSAIAVDGTGSAYVTGDTFSSDFPSTPGSFEPSFNGGEYDAFVAKLNPAGSALVYATFLGGAYSYEGGSAIAVDTSGRAYVTGYTYSTNFPTTPGAFDVSLNGLSDAYVAKLNATGSALIYASYLGGSERDYASALALDESGWAYLAGDTWSSNFPTTAGAFDTSHNGMTDVFVAKLNPAGSALAYSTFLGAGDEERPGDIALDANRNAYLTGATYSSSFPSTPGAFDTTYNGGPSPYPFDAFIAKLSPAGSALVYATFLGGSDGREGGNDIAVDGAGNALVVGRTHSSDFPATPGAFDTSFNGLDDTFVAKLNPTGSALVYSTFLGGTGLDSGSAISMDSSGQAYVSGDTNSSSFPSTPDAFDASHNGGNDAFVARLNPAGSALVYSTFLGGSGGDYGALVLDGAGKAYIVGTTESSDFPTTLGAFDVSYNGGFSDAFVTKLNLGPYAPNVVAPIGQPAAGAVVAGTVTLRGFAIDLGSSIGTGIDQVHIYLDGPSSSGVLLGEATYGLNRPDVAAQYGARFGPSGWELVWDTVGLAPGVHWLYLYAHRTTDNIWSSRPPHLVVAPGGRALWLPMITRNQ